MPKVSIITICYNDSGVKKTCESIMNQTYQDFEWIVIDGGSNQETIDVLNHYRDRINIFVSEKDNGVYHAMNKGIKLANGEYLHFLNAGDCYFDSNSLQEVSKFLNNHDIVFGNLKFLKDGGDFIKEYPDKIPSGWFKSGSLPHPASFIRKVLFDKYGLYNEQNKIVSDWEKWIEFIDINKCTYLHIPLLVSIHNYNGRSSVFDELHLDEIEKVKAKYYPVSVLKSKIKSFLKVVKNRSIKTDKSYLKKKAINSKVICIFNNQEIFDKVVKYNENLKSCDIYSYDNTRENVAITKRYNDFIDSNIDSEDFWCVFVHQDFGIMEDIDKMLEKLDKSCIHGAIGVKIYRGIFIGKKGKDGHIGLKRHFALTWGEIQQGHNGFNFTTYGKKVSYQKGVDSIDCCCIIMHSSLIKKYNLRFDENLKFHMYAEELCYSAKKNHRIKTKVVQMKCFHLGEGSLNDEYNESVKYLKDKFKIKRIPSTCPN